MRLYEILMGVLGKENDFVSDKGEVKKWVVADRARNYDETLLGVLLDNEELRAVFFKEVRGVRVFLLEKFLTFVEQKNYLNDSYTAYRNKIGLTIGGRLMSGRNEVELVWPYKDCVLEGGQTKEDAKRHEIFFNETLAQDEITKLLDPKVLTGYRQYGETGDKDELFRRDAEMNRKRGLPEDTITDNLIIKGNNLLALYSLKREFAGRVKLIYIDPPYNTGSDSFGYNDNFNHSTWLTFMKNRLEVARELLKEDGGMFISIDDKEQAYLKVLCDQIFKRENYVATFPWRKRTAKSDVPFGISQDHEFVLCYAKSKHFLCGVLKERKYFETEDFPGRPWRYHDLTKLTTAKERPNSYFTIVNPKNGTEYPADKQRTWCITTDTFDDYYKDNRIIFPGDYSFLDIRKPVLRYWKEADMEKNFGLTSVSTQFPPSIGMSQNGTKEITALLGSKAFAYPKPENLIGYLIEIASKESDIVLDFQLGSGTTAAVAHKMNRQYIGIEQMDYIQNVTIERLQKVIDGEQGGVSKAVGWAPQNPTLEDAQNGRYERNGFVYVELKRFNEVFVEQIEVAEDAEALTAVWEEMKEKAFFKYNVDMKKLEESREEFCKLALQEQKRVLLEILDKNQMYVNVSDMSDTRLGTTDEERKTTESFYKKK